MLARDVMTTTVATVSPDTPVPEIATLLLDRHISAAPVVDADNHILGIVSEGDLIHRAESDTERRRSWWLALLRTGAEDRAREYVRAHGRRAADVMTRDVVTVGEDTPLGELAELLERRRIKRVPVVRDGRLVGIVSRADLLRGLAAGRAAAQAPVTADDRAIREQLLGELDERGLVPTRYVNVVVADGVVHLWGLVDGPEQARAVRIAAETIPGVRAVEDHLGRRPPYAGGE
jgi:CBS domain-containing protein